MLGRRAFLEAAALGLISASLNPSGLFAQDPRPKTSKSKAKGKSSNAAKPNTDLDQKPLEPNEQINRILSQARTDGRRLPGIVGGIIRGEELAEVGAVGIRKIGAPNPILCTDLVHLGSCTKAMTATMLGTLVDEGKLRWDSTVTQVFPEWADDIHPDFKSVTLQQLLAHRAGFSHDLPWWQGGRGRSVVEQRRILMAEGLQSPPEVKPGSEYHYSNTGFVLAGMMGEQVTKTPWEDLMNQRLFRPLGMTTAGFGAPGTRGKLDHAWGHRAEGDTVEAVHQDNAAAMGPAGTVHCSIRDWARFASLHLHGSVGGVTLVKPETMKALHTPKAGEDYVAGWQVSNQSSASPILTHNGSNTLWYCSIWLELGKDLGYLVATNAAGKPAEDACSQAIRLLRQYANPNQRGRRR
jgi:CubicO group peptidase (beta-lactamase class C family)